MKSIAFKAVGEPSEVLYETETDVPVAAAGDALVRIVARPIQPADLAFIRGRYRITPVFPQPAGLEALGVILAAPEASGLYPGQRVALRSPGTWAEFAAVPVERLIPVPDGIADDDACQMALNPITAWGLLSVAKAAAGEALAITAATSTVAGILADLARMRGIFTIGIVRSAAGSAGSMCRTDAVVQTSAESLASAILDKAQGRPVTALIDSVGGPLVPQIMAALAPGANMVAYGVMDMSPALVTNASLIYGNLVWTGFGIDRGLAGINADAKSEMMDSLWSALRAGQMALPVAGRFPLANFKDALAADAAARRAGKILLV